MAMLLAIAARIVIINIAWPVWERKLLRNRTAIAGRRVAWAVIVIAAVVGAALGSYLSLLPMDAMFLPPR
jgi:hypothetical protein